MSTATPPEASNSPDSCYCTPLFASESDAGVDGWDKCHHCERRSRGRIGFHTFALDDETGLLKEVFDDIDE